MITETVRRRVLIGHEPHVARFQFWTYAKNNNLYFLHINT